MKSNNNKSKLFLKKQSIAQIKDDLLPFIRGGEAVALTFECPIQTGQTEYPPHVCLPG